MRTTRKQLENVLTELKKVSGIENLHLDFASCYGGYRLVKVNP